MVDIAVELAQARAWVRPTAANPRLGWAWEDPSYRASPARAFHGEGNALTVSDEGMPALESAVRALLADQRVSKNWREDDLWTAVLSLLAESATATDVDLDAAVKRLVTPRAVRVAAAAANVTWAAEPAVLGGLAVAGISSPDDIRSQAPGLGLDDDEAEMLVAYARELLENFDDFVLVTAVTPRQEQLAHQDLERRFDDLIGLTLLLSSNLADFGIYSLRGSTNRPGLRGTTLDREALGRRLGAKGSGELSSKALSITEWGARNSFRWHGAEPLPLDRILDAEVRARVGELLRAEDAIAQRLRVASRWYARGFWARTHDDAALAVSVALDAMLTGKDAVPGAVSKGRFALLERDPAKRADRFTRYERVYQVRSAIAHGGDASRRLAEIGGARSMLRDAQWVAQRLLEMRSIFSPKDERAFGELWAGIQWGTADWAAPPRP